MAGFASQPRVATVTGVIADNMRDTRTDNVDVDINELEAESRDIAARNGHLIST